MVFKLLESAQDRWRVVNGPHLVALVRAGARFDKGVMVERPGGPHYNSCVQFGFTNVLVATPDLVSFPASGSHPALAPHPLGSRQSHARLSTVLRAAWRW
jgi:hypothetical protein